MPEVLGVPPTAAARAAGAAHTPAVLVCLPLLSFAGVQRAALTLGHSLAERGVAVRWLVWQPLDEEGQRTRREWFGGEADRLTVYDPPRRRGAISATRLVAYLRRRVEPVVNLHYVTASSVSLLHVLCARLAGKRVVVSLHHPDEASGHRPAHRARVNRALKWAHQVVVTTPHLRDAIVRWSPRARVAVVPLGVPVPPEYDRVACRSSFDVPADAFAVAFLARMWRGKGLPTVVSAVRALNASGRATHLIAAGSGGPDERELRALVEAELGPRGRFAGFVRDHHRVLAAADVFAMPSETEGFGLTYVEAGMHGVPSIGAGVEGVPYVIDHGRTGYLVRVGDADAVAAHLTRLYDDRALLAQLGKAARERCRSEFTGAAMASGYISLIGDALPRRRALA